VNKQVTLFEMGPRDGLQNEKAHIPTADKIAFVDLLSGAGLQKIEVTSFVSPKWVPQMADAAAVLSGINRRSGVTYAALTPNLQGFHAAVAAKATEVAIFGSASETFSQKNINCSIAQSIERFKPVMDAAQAAGIRVRGYVSCAVHCPYEGAVPPENAASLAKQLLDIGCYEISLGDTTGQGTPSTIASMLAAVLPVVPADKLAGHYHDTGGQALDNVEVSLQHGVRTFDAATGGLGGCPYAPGAKGNVATATVVHRVESLGYTTGVDLDTLQRAETFIKHIVDTAA